MKIGIIGAGNIGSTMAQLFVAGGHDVAISNSRGPESLQAVVDELGPKARALSPDDAARWGDVILLAVPFRNPEALPSPETVTGKIVIDAMNAFAAPGGQGILDLGGETSSEQTRRRLPGARLVKAFNTTYYKHLASRARTDVPIEDRHVIFFSGDDASAKATVRKLIEEIGFGPLDMGPLVEGGRRHQPGTPVYNKPMTLREATELLNAAR
jgi:predicted dinucleotide-binding enzyme